MHQLKWRVMFIILYLMEAEAAEKQVMKDQYCTDPRTMKKHAAYTEWTDAYSCTRHRCQPGGRDLAIFTVGCKSVEAPESAIQCEEVVEDTNIQFPYCCTRLRCLVLVRGEVWTRVIGQPWEILPAAPWSHMYKKKKPPPGSSGLLTKNIMELPGPHITEDVANTAIDEGVKTRSNQPCTGHHDALRSSLPSPDIVIALTTGDEESETKKLNDDNNNIQSQRSEDFPDSKEDMGKLEKEFEDQNDIPIAKANESQETEDNSEFNLQTLVDAIGLRMKDIEDVVQKMSLKVEEGKKDIFKDDQETNVRSKNEEAKTELPAEDVTISYYNDPINLVQKSVKEPTQYIAPIEPRSHKTPEKKRKRRKKNRSGHKKRKDQKKKNNNKVIKEVDSAVLSIEDYNKYL